MHLGEPACRRHQRDRPPAGLLCQPMTTSPSPFIIASKPLRATIAGSSFFAVPSFVSSKSARSKKSVSVAPGMRHVTVTPLSFNSCRSANEKESRNALLALLDGLVGPGQEAGNRAGDEDAPLPTPPHVASDFLDEIHRAGDIGIDDLAYFIEVLVEKAFAQAAAGIGEQCVDPTAERPRFVVKFL